MPYQDRKSTRLNSSHGSISYAVFCLKKKKKRLNYSPGSISYAVCWLAKTRTYLTRRSILSTAAYATVSLTVAQHCAFFFFFNDTATTEIYTLSLHDALPI